ncbi:hypothetical protein EDB81DRAFT_893622 [Dactylonectria macrodidyma]|uniref:Uncharacterized protein n=1 Tax=Dactylonectria macrodidyma TaxID=307937 RepID=A0A9P9D659_9HYPO|nr:hypothetical protein EDB81DRAFT_893622 [Dactylonectria macrodidyma]
MPDIKDLKVGAKLQAKDDSIAGTRAESMILFTDVRIVNTPGRGPYEGDVLVEADKITAVGHIPNRRQLEQDPRVKVIRGRGRTPMPT